MKSSEFIVESAGQEYGIQYKVFAGREGRVTTKEKWFSSAQRLEAFANKLQDTDNFYEISGYSYPNGALGADPVTESAGQEYGIQYKVFAGREGRVTTKEKWFSSAQRLEAFANKLQDTDNFYEISGYSYPNGGNDALGADPVTESPSDYMMHGIGGNRGDSFGPYKLKRDGRIISGHKAEAEALAAWKQLPDSRGVKIVKESIRESRIVHTVLNRLTEDVDAGATSSASIAAAPAQNLTKKPASRVKKVSETASVTDYNPKSQGGTRKELLAKYKKSGSAADAAAARKAGATQAELRACNAGATSSASDATPAKSITKKPVTRSKVDESLPEINAGPVRKPSKADRVFSIRCDRGRGNSSNFTGTLAELIDSFSYTLETGAAYQHGRGAKKINRNPATIATLVTNLNNAVNNSASNGYAGKHYVLVNNTSTVTEIDNGPGGRVSPNKINYSSTRNATGGALSKNDLAANRDRQSAPKSTAAPSIDLDRVWAKVEDVVGQSVPDGDPIDSLAPWLMKQGISEADIGDLLRKAARKHGYKDLYAYYDEVTSGHNQ